MRYCPALQGLLRNDAGVGDVFAVGPERYATDFPFVSHPNDDATQIFDLRCFIFECMPISHCKGLSAGLWFLCSCPTCLKCSKLILANGPFGRPHPFAVPFEAFGSALSLEYQRVIEACPVNLDLETEAVA